MSNPRPPAEWEPHSACWLAWPSAQSLWQEDLKPTQEEFAALCRAIRDFDSHNQKFKGEELNILVDSEKSKTQVEQILGDLKPNLFNISYGDIWLRDTAPIFIRSENGRIGARRFIFNGWGGKYVLPGDDHISMRIAEILINKMSVTAFPFVLEGGSLEPDDVGTCLTTEQCLLNKNRNPGLNREQIEEALKESLGFTKILWLTEGLMNDHTDGHIDTLARFAPDSQVVCMRAQKDSDPNARVLEKISKELSKMSDAEDRKLKVIEIPSPGRILDDDGTVMPASYVNFYISNSQVIVPVYGSEYDDAAVKAIAQCYPDKKTIGLSALSILKGGGAFHCITQQVPEAG